MEDFRHLAVFLSVLLFAPLVGTCAQKAAGKGNDIVYVGTYTKGESKGIYGFRFQAGTGKMEPLGLMGETPNPSFVAIHPNRRYLYAVGEGGKEGTVSAFAIEPGTGKLTFLNKVSSRGGGPCFVKVDATGKNVLVTNYNTGSVAVLPLKDDGSLAESSAFIQHTGSSVNPARQKGPHAHSVNLSPDNRFAIVADLGLDRIFVYRFDAAKGSLTPNDPPYVAIKPGSGPRHFAFHPNGRFAYALSEMAGTVTAFRYDAKRGVLTEIETVSNLPKDFTGSNISAEVQVHPSGKFLYASNRGHDSIAVFAIDQRKGTLTPIEHVSTQGKFPRNFAIDPTGSYLVAANQNSNNIVVFRIDAKTGRLTPTGQTFEVSSPVCVRFMATD